MALEVMGQMRRDGLRLLLILPDGSRSLIPAEWTDWAAGQQPVAVDATVARRNLGTLAELLRARAVVNALLDRLVPVRDGPPASAEEERSRATETWRFSTIPSRPPARGTRSIPKHGAPPSTCWRGCSPKRC